MTNFDKLNLTLRYWLLGMSNSNPEYLKCLEAMEFAKKLHDGVRKDKITPEFEHQLVISHYVRTLPNLQNIPATLMVALLHDTQEDKDISKLEIENKFGRVVADANEKLTKVFRGNKKNEDEYFNAISECPIASIVKGGDRIHNLQSMVGVFTKEKQIEYIKEAEEKIIPALKKARRNFPSQELAYENIKLMMKSQIYLIKASH